MHFWVETRQPNGIAQIRRSGRKQRLVIREPPALTLLFLGKLFYDLADLNLVNPMLRFDTTFVSLGKHTNVTSNFALDACFLPSFAKGSMLLRLIRFPAALGL